MSDVHSALTAVDPRLSRPPAVALVGKDHRFLAVTEAFAEVIGYTPEELFGKTFEQITHPADVDIDSDLAKQVFQGKLDHYDMAKRYLHKDGHIVRVLLIVTVARGQRGEITCAVSTIHPLDSTLPTKTLPAFQHDDEPNDEIERIKNAMFF